MAELLSARSSLGPASDRSRGVRRMLRCAVLAACALLLLPSLAGAVPTGDIWISEVMYNPGPSGLGVDDDDREWVEIYNAGSTAIDLSTYTLQWGTTGYNEVLALTGTIQPGEYMVIGGTTMDAGNGGPYVFQPIDMQVNLGGAGNDLPNPFLFAGGIALFDSASATPANPVHALIYGGLLGNLVFGLIDETGAPGAVNGPGPLPGAGQSIVFDGTNFVVQAVPDPGAGALPVPESGPVLLMMLGLTGLFVRGTPRPGARRRQEPRGAR